MPTGRGLVHRNLINRSAHSPSETFDSYCALSYVRQSENKTMMMSSLITIVVVIRVKLFSNGFLDREVVWLQGRRWYCRLQHNPKNEFNNETSERNHDEVRIGQSLQDRSGTQDIFCQQTGLIRKQKPVLESTLCAIHARQILFTHTLVPPMIPFALAYHRPPPMAPRPRTGNNQELPPDFGASLL